MDWGWIASRLVLLAGAFGVSYGVMLGIGKIINTLAGCDVLP